MKIEICKLDSNRNLDDRELKWLVQAIESFIKNVSEEEAMQQADNRSNAFSYYALRAFDKRMQSSIFIFMKEWILRENQRNIKNSNPAALATLCRKAGLLYDQEGRFELSEMARDLLLSNRISTKEFAFLLLSKQWVRLDEVCKVSLLAMLYQLINQDKDFLQKFYDKNYNKEIIRTFFKECAGRPYDNKQDSGDDQRLDILRNLLKTAGLVEFKGSKVNIPPDALKILSDFDSHSSELTPYTSNKQFYSYICASNYGLFEILNANNAGYYMCLYPNLVSCILNKESMNDNQTPMNLVRLLLNKKNLILTGAPGTGKTFAARQVAAYIVSNGARDYDALLSDEKKRVGFTQFHPSYDYTDFVEGLRPVSGGNFERKSGVFKSFCEEALKDDVINFETIYKLLVEQIETKAITHYDLMSGGKNALSVKGGQIYYHTGQRERTENLDNMKLLFEDYLQERRFDLAGESSEALDKRISDLTNGRTKNLDSSEYKWTLSWLLLKAESMYKPYVFIIDEINRGELSKIFGELFCSIEPEYRGKYPVKTQYENMIKKSEPFNDGFYVPTNVFILGTMNDVDRGVEAMDFAIRRRFAWHEVTAEDSAMSMGIKGGALAKMNAINAIIEEQLGRAYCIGGSYFRKFDKDGADATWENHLYGILYEYYRGDPKADDKLKDIEKAYKAAKETLEDDNPSVGVVEADV